MTLSSRLNTQCWQSCKTGLSVGLWRDRFYTWEDLWNKDHMNLYLRSSLLNQVSLRAIPFKCRLCTSTHWCFWLPAKAPSAIPGKKRDVAWRRKTRGRVLFAFCLHRAFRMKAVIFCLHGGALFPYWLCRTSRSKRCLHLGCPSCNTVSSGEKNAFLWFHSLLIPTPLPSGLLFAMRYLLIAAFTSCNFIWITPPTRSFSHSPDVMVDNLFAVSPSSNLSGALWKAWRDSNHWH